MRAIDPRLLHRARPARVLLAADAALGVTAALLTLAQAVLIASVAARAFAGASLADVGVALALLAAGVVARAGTTWGFELAGRRAATDVLSQLRLDLVGRRLRDRPAALDGVESAEVATVAVGGLDALETAYARYLPQMVLAVVVPVAVLCLAAVIDPVSAAVMLLTLPLVPVFMWLELAATLGIALVAVTVGVRLVEGGVGFEAGLTVLLLAPELYLPLRNLAAQYHASADGLSVAKRLLDLIEDGPAAARGGVRPPKPSDVPVRLEDVSFAYPARDGLVLDAVDVELGPGETVALVGPTGSGKTTIGSLLLRLADPTSGRLLAGNVDLAACDPAARREQIAWVPQRPTLFRGTIADNIRLGRPSAHDDEVRRAAAHAGADAFVADLPDGYETAVGDGGRPLSAGQVQRLALARAFLRDAPLVILDEPTANLDPVSAELVGEAVDRLRGGRSVLLIVHRPELARRADRIVTLDAGRIVEPARDAA